MELILRQYKVSTQSFRVEPEQLRDIPLPFMAHLNYPDRFELVISLKGNEITTINEEGKKITRQEDVFVKEWDGVAMIAESRADSAEPEHALHQRESAFHRIVIVLTAICLLTLLASPLWINNTNLLTTLLPYWVSILITLFGIVTGLILLLKTFNKTNPMLNKICSLGKNTDCTSILTSKAATIAGVISWSDIGLLYFTGNCIVLLLCPQADAKSIILTLWWLNLLSLPYTLFSVYYQWRVAKQWCVLCLTVQALLILQFLSLTWLNNHIAASDFSLRSIFILLLGFGIPASIWLLIKPMIKENQGIRSLQFKLNRFLGNEAVFYQALQQGQEQVVFPGSLSLVKEGNPNADFMITMITNPYCGPCAAMHKKLEGLLQLFPDELCVATLFAVGDDPADRRWEMAAHTLSLPDSIQGKSMADWFNSSKPDYNIWARKYSVEKKESTKAILSEHDFWCKKLAIAATPTLFINGYPLPLEYDAEDLVYYIGN
jgi:uncharacterized membrane protein